MKIVPVPVETQMAPSGPWVLLTKLQPPPVREQMLVRERLLDRLTDGSRARLTLVAGPAGSGKTTLLAEWFGAERVDKPAAWLTLDRADNDPVVLWSHVIEGLRRADSTLTEFPQPALLGGVPITATVLPGLVNVLSEQGPTVLVLDDFHRVSAGPARDSVGWFLERVPTNVQLVISTRTEPPFALSSLRAHGELLELRVDDLRFTREEAAALLNDRLGLDLPAEDIDLLVERTEGWPAGVYLATFSLARVDDQHAFLLRFGGTNRHVVDFLSDEVLASHESTMLELMLGASILERFTGPLCDFVLERERSADMLAELARSNLFVVRLDEELGWYRFHHVFSQLLRIELERRDPGRAAKLHRRASLWHVDWGTREEAIEHALDGGAFVEAADLISSSYPVFGNTGRLASVLSWLQRLPDEQRHHDVRLRLAAAWLLSLSGRAEEAQVEIAAAERLAPRHDGALPDGFSSVESSLSLWRAIYAPGDVHQKLEMAVEAAGLERPGSPWRPVACWTAGRHLYFSGMLEEADPWLEEAAAQAPVAQQWIVAGSALAYRSLVAGERGLIDQQVLLAEQADEIGRRYGLADVTAGIHLAVGMSLAARGKDDEALPRLETGVATLRIFGQPSYLVRGLLQEAAVLKRMGQRERFAAVIAEARQLLKIHPDLAFLSSRIDTLQRRSAETPSADDELSERELTVLRLLRGDLTQREIGRELCLSHNTVHSHVRSIYRKLGASSRGDAVAIARTRGLL